MKVSRFILIFFFFVFSLLTWLVSENFFFWDTIQLASIPAHFYYENNFSELFLPMQYDTGHIPAFGAYLAIVWSIFSKSLAISHFAMLPFIFGVVYQMYLLIKRYVSSDTSIFLLLILALIDPTFLSQAILVSPDIPLLFLFLLGVNSVLSRKKILLTVAITALFVINMRGIIIASFIFLIDIIFWLQTLKSRKEFKKLFEKVVCYIPGVVLLFLYQYFHFQKAAWIWSHEASPWIRGRDSNNFSGGLYNTGIFIWRLIDFGRVFIYIILIPILIRYRKRIFLDKRARELLLIITLISAFLLCPFVYYKHLTGHRYLLPIYLSVSIFIGYLITNYIQSRKRKLILMCFLFLGLISGNFWIYPSKISQGWDSTLAHVSYYSLYKEMIHYLDQENIELEEVGSGFPSLEKQKYIFVNNDNHRFKEKNVLTDSYVLYSNVFNSFKDNEQDVLNKEFKLKKELKLNGVYLRLYEK